MAFDPGAVSTQLAAAVGDDPLLVAELRQAFTDSAADAVETLRNAPDEAEWSAAAARLKGLAASFGALRLMALASEAERIGRVAALLKRIERTAERL